MSEDQNENMTDHEYDGIRELDNNLPEWWLALFFATIIFGAIYWLHYESGSGPTMSEDLKVAMAAIQAQKGSGPSFSEDQLAGMFTAEVQTSGKEVFLAKCAACHTANGAGLIGPNLTDKFWIQGKGTRADIFQIIVKGVPEKGMPAWGEQLSETDLIAAAAFVHSINGTNVSGGKPPQGDEVP
jgi:cytochrome c oxidase cbb3-type subunit 3